ncbi:MAG: Asp23/Gls24 family envelope stress response protein [Anaerovoracaceae bacterium]|jgi:uncharacterized alkaline shock family protein YloU
MPRKKNEGSDTNYFDNDIYENESSAKASEDSKLDDEVIAVCAVNAALRTDGVAHMYTGITDSISETILGKESMSKGVRLDRSDEAVAADIYVIVEYGVNIPDVAFSLQRNVKEEIESMTDEEVRAVNIHIQGTDFGEDEEDEETEQGE